MTPRGKPLPLASLVEDLSVYPRNRIDDAHVSDLVRALQSSAVLPPIVAEEKSLRIVDGIHRRRAYLKHAGEEATASVELRRYPSDTDLFVDAVALNSTHGRKLDRHDQTRIVMRMREFRVPDQEIALHLHVPEIQVTQLAIRIVMAPNGPLPSKRGLEFMRGTTLTDEQVAVMESVRSAEAGRLALELSRLLNAGMVDLQDDTIVARLTALQSAIASALKQIAA